MSLTDKIKDTGPRIDPCGRYILCTRLSNVTAIE